MAAWSDGYFTDVPYTSHFYPHLAPGFLAFACLRQGVRPPRLGEGAVYLELGCGQGYSLNVLAAANPGMRFIGVDFLPGQIANAQELATAAGLSNVTFEDFSFAQVLALPEGRIPKCDVIALHGIWSWVGEPQRREIVQILDRLLKPGGLAYVSYNTLPGWAPLIGLQRFLRGYVARHPGDPRVQVVEGLRAALQMIEDGASSLKNTPTIKATIESQLKQSPTYLVHEHLNAHSNPSFHADVVEALEPARLTYAGTANQGEDMVALAAAPKLRPEIKAAESVWRETLLDYASDKRFRRDIFVRGRNALSTPERDQRLAETRFALVQPRPGMDFAFQVPIGKLNGAPEIYAPIVDALEAGPKSYGEIAALPALADLQDGMLRQAFALLVGGRRIHPLGEAADPAPARAFNAAVLARLPVNRSPGYLASPVVGTGVGADFNDLLGVGAAMVGETGAGPAAARGAEILVAGGAKLRTSSEVLSEPAAIAAELESQLKGFAKTRLPFFRQLGVV